MYDFYQLIGSMTLRSKGAFEINETLIEITLEKSRGHTDVRTFKATVKK